MKRVLITGANSYVGTNVENWLMKEPDKYYVETLDMKDPNWIEFDFSNFDVVFHVAGIAHVSTKKSMKDLYYKVNRDLAIETAEKAKESGVKQFIFMSSMIVYNSKETRISKETIPNPDNFYGDSKLQAEKAIQRLESNNFKLCILRPPMIYGYNSKGNLSKLRRLTETIPIFPKFNNKKSVLYIETLDEIVKFLIDYTKNGVFFPQEIPHISTTHIVELLSIELNKKIYFTSLFNPIIKLLSKMKFINKIFGNHYYNYDLTSNVYQCIIRNSSKYTIKTIIPRDGDKPL